MSLLTAQIKGHLEPSFSDVWVTGEISQFTRAASGHIYLTLKDTESSLKSVIWRSTAYRLKFDPKPGMEVIAHGKIDVYTPNGEYKLVIDALEPKGVGAAELALRQLKEKLFKKGYFERDRKRPLPPFPRRIGIVSSATGAAVRDILELLAQRWPVAEVIVRHSRVQGAGAGEEIAEAVRELSALHSSGACPFDALIVGRGGGSSEDLASFNEEVVADALFESSIPIISAVGHEIDLSIADLVADYRAETPSAAVTALTPDRSELMAGLLSAAERLHSAATGVVRRGRERVELIGQRPVFRKPFDRIREREQRLDEMTARLVRAASVRMDRAKEQLASVAGRLDGLSPLNVLTRGYSLTTKQGAVIREAQSLSVGDEIITRLAKGEAVSTVTATR
ncbi:MAG: exodeoxyribonuclease VII large subunit [Gemmataceae bacterium]